MPIYEYHCNTCNRNHDELTYSQPKAQVRCGVDGCDGVADKLAVSPFSATGLSNKSGSSSRESYGVCPVFDKEITPETHRIFPIGVLALRVMKSPFSAN